MSVLHKFSFLFFAALFAFLVCAPMGAAYSINVPEECPDGWYYDYSDGQCHLTCPDGQHAVYDGSGGDGRCVENTVGKEDQDGVCVGNALRSSLASPTWYIDENGKCQPSCPSGWYYNADASVCYKYCAADSVYSESDFSCHKDCSRLNGGGQTWEEDFNTGTGESRCLLACSSGEAVYSAENSHCCLDGWYANHDDNECHKNCEGKYEDYSTGEGQCLDACPTGKKAKDYVDAKYKRHNICVADASDGSSVSPDNSGQGTKGSASSDGNTEKDATAKNPNASSSASTSGSTKSCGPDEKGPTYYDSKSSECVLWCPDVNVRRHYFKYDTTKKECLLFVANKEGDAENGELKENLTPELMKTINLKVKDLIGTHYYKQCWKLNDKKDAFNEIAENKDYCYGQNVQEEVPAPGTLLNSTSTGSDLSSTSTGSDLSSTSTGSNTPPSAIGSKKEVCNFASVTDCDKQNVGKTIIGLSKGDRGWRYVYEDDDGVYNAGDDCFTNQEPSAELKSKMGSNGLTCAARSQ